MNQVQWIMKSMIGDLYIVTSEKGLCGIFWKQKPAPMAKSLRGESTEVKYLARVVRELEEYFAGKRTSFEIPFDIQGTEFQRKVWNELSKIPYGKTCSYKDIAKKIKSDKAVRAVGTANGRNPISIIVPCHRVVASDGKLGGYAGGLPIKEKLLALENAKLQNA